MPKYFLCQDYVNSVNALRQNGGINSKKAEKANAIWGVQATESKMSFMELV